MSRHEKMLELEKQIQEIRSVISETRARIQSTLAPLEAQATSAHGKDRALYLAAIEQVKESTNKPIADLENTIASLQQQIKENNEYMKYDAANDALHSRYDDATEAAKTLLQKQPAESIKAEIIDAVKAILNFMDSPPTNDLETLRARNVELDRLVIKLETVVEKHSTIKDENPAPPASHSPRFTAAPASHITTTDGDAAAERKEPEPEEPANIGCCLS